MTFFQTILTVALAGFVLYGLWFGLVHTLGTLVGTIGGAFVAGYFYDSVAAWFFRNYGGNLNVGRVIAFFLVFVIANRLIGLIFLILEKMFQFISIVPFLKSINRLLGALLGLLEGGIVLGLALYLVQQYPFGPVKELIATSSLAHFLLAIANILVPILPDSLRLLIGIPLRTS